MYTCRRFIVSGRVQGVSFRASTLDTARRLGVTGWVRNLPNGDVETVACGEPGTLAAFERWLWQGPKLARVTGVEGWDVPNEVLGGFEVR